MVRDQRYSGGGIAPGGHAPVDPARRRCWASCAGATPDLGLAEPSAEVIRTSEPLLWPEMTPEVLRRYVQDEEQLQMTLALGVESGLAVPLIARGVLIGVISLFTARPERRFAPSDLELIQEIGRRAAVAIDNAQLYRRAEEAIQVRDEFLSVASHELNTPVTTLMLNLQAMLSPEPGEHGHLDGDGGPGRAAGSPAVRAGPRGAARRQPPRLRRLAPRATPTWIWASSCARPWPVRARSSGAPAVSLSIEAEAGLVGGRDSHRLDRVLVNLLSNACKFGPGKPIEVRVWRQGEVARIPR